MSHVIPVNQVDSLGADATDPATHSVRVNVVAGSGGGGGGAVTIADGADVAEGAVADAAWSGSGSGSVVAILKRLAKPSTTGTTTSVAGSASSVTLLAANAARFGATVYNDSSAVLYLKLGATASTSSYTVQLVAGAYYETPFAYTGIIDGIWASAAGNARITEVT